MGRCEYDGGVFDHDLSKCEFEVVEVASAASSEGASASGDGAVDIGDGGYGQNFQELTPKRRWLAKQESDLEQFVEELEQADIGTPMNSSAAIAGTPQGGGGLGGKLRARMSLKHVKQPQAATPRTPRAADGTVEIVDPSDAAVTYRKLFKTGMTPMGRTPGAPIATPMCAQPQLDRAKAAEAAMKTPSSHV